MSYVKPGVEITQVQRSFSPTLISPDLPAVVVGAAYSVVNAEGVGSYPYATYTASAATSVAISGLSSSLYLDANSVYVDLVLTSGANAGNRLHLEKADITVSNGGTSFTIASGVAPGATWNGAAIYVGYRALNYNYDLCSTLKTIEAVSDLDVYFGSGQAVVDNPLPFALSVALSNTATSVFGVALGTDDLTSTAITASGTASTEHARAIALLATQEVYAITPLTSDTSIFSSYRSHVDAQSTATEKKERIVFLTPKITWGADNATTSRTIRDNASAVGMKRSFYTFPDVAYFRVTSWPVQKLKSTYINAMYAFSNTEYALLANTYTLASGTIYKAGTPITSSVYADLKADTKYYQFNAYIPVPGSFVGAAIAGQVSGQLPEQGHTNLPIAGPSNLKYSNEWFTEAQLNTMATGGNYIMTSVGGVVACRHQLSTDMTSIERRELSITKTVDFVSKYIRNTVSGYIGRSLITPQFLKILGSIISGLGQTLVREGRLNSFSLLSLAQDSVAKDTILVSIQIGPKYPVNYIKIDLIF